VLLRAARIPEGLAHAYAAAREDLATQFLAYWLAGYHMNRGNPKPGQDVLFRIFGSVFKSTTEVAWDLTIASEKAPALERNYPLAEEDLKIIREGPDALVAARRLVEARCPEWFLGWRDICRATDERTVIASMIPRAGVGHTTPLMLFSGSAAGPTGCLLANLSSFVLDYCARQKVGGTHLTYGYVNQLPVLTPAAFVEPTPWAQTETLVAWIRPRILELTYTAWDLASFARDCDYEGRPFRWDEKRRILLRCELDAAFFHLYGIARDDVDYIMETFPIVKRDDVKRHGEYRTKRVILEIYDALAESIRTGQPYHTCLDPPPADPRCCHPLRNQRWTDG
jgi:hypothetical protein